MRRPLLGSPLLAALTAGCLNVQPDVPASCPPSTTRLLTDDRLTVRTVSDLYAQHAVPGVRVQVDDGPWIVTSSAGDTSIEGISAPYSAVLHQTEVIDGRVIHDVWSLHDRREDPLEVEVSGEAYRRQCIVDVPVIGIASTESVVQGWVQDTFGQGGLSAEGQLRYAVSWSGPGPYPAVLLAAEIRPGPPPRFVGFGRADISLDAGCDSSTTTAVSATTAVMLRSVHTQFALGDVLLPPSFNEPTVTVSSALQRTGLVTLGSTPLGTTTSSYALIYPQVSDAAFYVLALAVDRASGARSASAQAITPPVTGVGLDLVAPVEILSPTDGSTVADDAAITWTRGEDDGRYELKAQCAWLEGEQPVVARYRAIETRDLQANLPALPELILPSGARCTAHVWWYPDERNQGCQSNYAISEGRTFVIE